MFSKERGWGGIVNDMGEVLGGFVVFEGDTASGEGIFVGCQVGRVLQKD